MYTIVATVTLPYPADVVFAALASLEGTVRWQAGVRAVRRARRLPGSAGGARTVPPLVLHYWALGVRHALHASVTAHEPPHRFAYRAVGTGLAYDATFAVAPSAQGCHVTCTVLVAADGAALEGAPGHAPADAPGHAPADAAPGADVVRLRRLLARRLPADLARLEAWVAVQPGARRAAGAPVGAPVGAPAGGVAAPADPVAPLAAPTLGTPA